MSPIVIVPVPAAPFPSPAPVAAWEAPSAVDACGAWVASPVEPASLDEHAARTNPKISAAAGHLRAMTSIPLDICRCRSRFRLHKWTDPSLSNGRAPVLATGSLCSRRSGILILISLGDRLGPLNRHGHGMGTARRAGDLETVPAGDPDATQAAEPASRSRVPSQSWQPIQPEGQLRTPYDRREPDARSPAHAPDALTPIPSVAGRLLPSVSHRSQSACD